MHSLEGETYRSIANRLGLDATKDSAATAELDKRVGEFDLDYFKGLLAGKKVIVFGAGPSLADDVRAVRKSRLLGDAILVAADGAAKALTLAGLVPHVIVTDLDGAPPTLIWCAKHGSAVVVHAHADNILRMRTWVPRLKGKVFGTTQRAPTSKVLNFGGFTDGDRAVYLAEHFRPQLIALAGMDFGVKVGRYSHKFDPKKKPEKLAVGKWLLEQLAADASCTIVNVTSAGEDIKGIPKASVNYVESL